MEINLNDKKSPVGNSENSKENKAIKAPILDTPFKKGLFKRKSNRKKTKQGKRVNSSQPSIDSAQKINVANQIDTQKDQKKEKRKLVWKYVRTILISILLTGLIGGGVWAYKNYNLLMQKMGIEVKVKDVVDVITKPEEVYKLKTDKSGSFTNVLAVGIDTREDQKGLQNTDTIMVGSYNHETGDIVMLSIPRDTYVEFKWLGRNYNKINAVYNGAEQAEKGSGLKALKAVVEEYLGLDIQYYGMIDYQGFISAVDTVGGITVDVENTFTDYQFPAPAGSAREYMTVHFDKGEQVMDGETALIYARSRHSLNNGEGSDFARAKRQQNVVRSLQAKLLSSETWLSPEKILGLISDLGNNIKLSEISVKDIKAGLDLADSVKDANFYSFVFDPTIGNWQVIYEDRATYAIVPKLGVGNYDDTNAITANILESPKLYQEDALIRVYDAGLGYYPTLTLVGELQKAYPYLEIVYGGTRFYDKEGTFVYVNSTDSDFAATAKEFIDYYEITDEAFMEKPAEIEQYFGNQDVTILIGKEIVVEETPTPVETEISPAQ